MAYNANNAVRNRGSKDAACGCDGYQRVSHLQYLTQIAPPWHPMGDIINQIGAAARAQRAAVGKSDPLGALAWLDIEAAMMLDPVQTLQRFFRMKLLGGVVSSSVLTFTPEVDCIPVRGFIPAGTADKSVYITNLQCGLKQYFASNDGINAQFFDPQQALETGYLRPYILRVGQTVNGTVAAGTLSSGCGLLVADISRNGLRQPLRGPLSRLGPSGSDANVIITVTKGTSKTVTFTPQVRFGLRKITVKTSSVTTPDDLTVTAVKVGIEPQFLSGDAVTINVFTAATTGVWVDGDIAEIGQDITVTLKNADGVNDDTLDIELEGDVVPEDVN